MNWNKYLNSDRLRFSTRMRDLDSRNEFESDFGRVIFSPAVRRMHDKTQVFPLTDNDNIHSRLTHSLEVMSVGYSIALSLSRDKAFLKKAGFQNEVKARDIPDIVKSACLIHDVGNPPFGHFGETVIQNYFKELFKTGIPRSGRQFDLSPSEEQDFTLFDGNAQGFRVLTKLQILDDTYGLNLTYATLGAFLKYPNTGGINKQILSQKKRGVFNSEKEYLHQIGEHCGLTNGDIIMRHPLSYIMEAADSICYLVMDIEDAFNKKWIDFHYIKRHLEHNVALKEIFEEIDRNRGTEFNDHKKMVDLRLALIKYLVHLAGTNYMEHLDEICKGRYNQELIYDDPNGLAKCLSTFCLKHIFSHKEIVLLELTGYSVLKGLLDCYIDFCFHDNPQYREKGISSLSNSIVKAALLESEVEEFDDMSDYYKLRAIVDFISGMTDQYALSHFQKISGQKI